MGSEALNQRFVYFPRVALYASLAIHLGLVFCFLTAKILDKYNIHLFNSKKKSTTDMYQTFIQVDVVSLPDQMINEKIDANLPIVDVPKKVADPAKADSPDHIEENLKGEELKQAQEAMAEKAKKEKAEKEKVRKADQEKALKQLKEEANREKALKALQAKTGKTGRGKIAGNILSKGTSMTGNIGNAKDQYTSRVTQAIKEHFRIYPWQRKKPLVAVVYITIYPTGRVREKRLTKRSADSTFDSAVLQAVDEAQPLPVPEDPSIISEGITIEFRPEG